MVSSESTNNAPGTASNRSRNGPPRGRRPGQSTEQTKKALLRSARQVFAENGYERATIAEIVRRAGVTSPVLYHHFGNKAGLFREAVTEVADLLRGAWDRAVRDKVTLRERLDAMLVAAIDIHALDPQLAPFLIAARIETVRHPELQSMNEYRRSAISIFEKVVADSEVDEDRRRAIVHVCGAMFAGLTVIGAESAQLDYDTAAESLREILDSSLFD